MLSQPIVSQFKLKSSTLSYLPINIDTKRWNIGIAGPVAGVIHDKIIIGGGANFPEGPPWLGGKKIYHQHLYSLSKSLLGRYKWKKIEFDLPHSLGYSANVSTQQGLLVIGGDNEYGDLKSVYLIKENGGKLQMVRFKDLPIAVTATSAVAIDGKIFLPGGMSGSQATKSLYCLDNIDEKTEWKKLPDMPEALSNAVVVHQNDGQEECIFVVGGRNKYPNDITTTFSSKVLKYQPSQQIWTHVGDLQYNLIHLPLAAGTGIALDNDEIVLFGGDDGTTFNKIEQYNHDIQNAEGIEKTRLIDQKNELLTHHTGFNKRILLYNVKTNSTKNIGSIDDFTQVTTSAFYFKKDIIIPSGEIKPGIRTPKIIKITVKQ